ncbi:hypothetical protein [Leclercia sp. UBA7405]|uniref:hypothetical protein n=1 Tax=Leclercia sp. UBA7405 TaxID=1946743 RepID=UPI00301841A7
MTKQAWGAALGQKWEKYFAKQIVSFRLCGEIKPALRYSAGGNAISYQKLGAYREQTYNDRKRTVCGAINKNKSVTELFKKTALYTTACSQCSV